MKKKLLKGIITLCAGIFTTIAMTMSTYACIVCFYQPEEPKSLRDE